MLIGTVKIRLHAPYVHSLKEKRMIVKSIIGKVKSRFNVSVAEVEEQDIHQIIVIGIAYVSNQTGMCDRIIDNMLDLIEGYSDVEILDVEREIV